MLYPLLLSCISLPPQRVIMVIANFTLCRWNDVNCDSLASLVVEYGDSPQNVDPPQEGRLLVEDVPDEL